MPEEPQGLIKTMTKNFILSHQEFEGRHCFVVASNLAVGVGEVGTPIVPLLGGLMQMFSHGPVTSHGGLLHPHLGRFGLCLTV